MAAADTGSWGREEAKYYRLEVPRKWKVRGYSGGTWGTVSSQITETGEPEGVGSCVWNQVIRHPGT